MPATTASPWIECLPRLCSNEFVIAPARQPRGGVKHDTTGLAEFITGRNCRLNTRIRIYPYYATCPTECVPVNDDNVSIYIDCEVIGVDE